LVVPHREDTLESGPTFRRSSQAEGERAPGSSGPAHLGHIRPKN
jgi:hypothetical protein